MGRMLEGVKILDLSMNLPGPYCTMLLSDLGADVIKIEEPRIGDQARVLNEPFFDQLNRGKRSVKLNLKNTAGRQAFLELARHSDAVLESFRPGVVERLGVDYRAVSAVNPRIIYCSISGFGQDGPMRDVPCHDLNIISMTGIQHMTGVRGGPPVMPSVLIADTATGTLAALAIVAALWQRTVKNRGQYLDLSMYESCFSWQHIHAAFLLSGFEYGAGEGMLSGAAPCYNLYRAADGRYVSIGAVEPHFWAGICKLLNKEHLIDKQFSSGEEAERAREELQDLFLTRTSAQWMEILGPAGLCVAPVLTLRESLDHPQARHREVIITGESNGATVSQLNSPIKGTGLDRPEARKGPALGEHNAEVFREIGMSEEEIDTLKKKGAFST
ncbi:MAG: CoA transferase [Peptococcaceae bacterium]|nr:CoA transferase [Peptococcaceae bacterium]